MHEIVFTPEALNDLREALRWYEEREVGLGTRFESAVASALSRISRMPEGAPELVAPFRRVVVRRFPYDLYYSVGPSTVLIVLIEHTARDPASTLRRLRRH